MTAVQPITSEPSLRKRTAAATRDTALRQSLASASDLLSTRKSSAYSQLADAPALREEARAIKARILARLPDILERLADNVIARGGHVHWAATAADANAVIAEIAAHAGARSVIKSKSMASEETGLNEALEARGCVVTETDLGEWIIQVAGQTPSHIIVPAVHLNRHQVAEALRKVADGDLSDVPEELTAFARRKLRERFLTADMGVSGVNFGIAETGSLLLVTNEGNGRMVTSLPRVHVALMGMERVVETWSELDVMLALLPRAATGQSITTYTSVITGPRSSGESDGPEELHLVILDNGRSDILGTEFSEMLACIRCGACLNVCPVYRQVGGHAYGSVYPGPMGAVLTPLLNRSEAAGEVAYASSLCGACHEACPVGIPLQDMLLGLRLRDATTRPHRRQRLALTAWSMAWSRPRLYRASLRAASLGYRLLRRPRRTPWAIDRWSAGRDLPVLARRSFRDLWSRGDL
ncbi:MAG TPA: LutB/LldF family L-lactate oxidation iron-sulfur protein [Candidatus Dormibacteraeota bacterium]|nr:LutB/LldF family L-lactate oxidation iron-sulfur protein [Candidatus Dormibacteraeota bacterium]